jgi:hypothetical protein
MLSQGIRQDPLVLDVREPRSLGFLLGEGDIVAVLLGFAMEQTELGSLEWCGDDAEQGGGREHNSGLTSSGKCQTEDV